MWVASRTSKLKRTTGHIVFAHLDFCLHIMNNTTLSLEPFKVQSTSIMGQTTSLAQPQTDIEQQTVLAPSDNMDHDMTSTVAAIPSSPTETNRIMTDVQEEASNTANLTTPLAEASPVSKAIDLSNDASSAGAPKPLIHETPPTDDLMGPLLDLLNRERPINDCGKRPNADGIQINSCNVKIGIPLTNSIGNRNLLSPDPKRICIGATPENAWQEVPTLAMESANNLKEGPELNDKFKDDVEHFVFETSEFLLGNGSYICLLKLGLS
jgi:hypothetical protein